jgi:hypothetical protein
MVYNTRPGEHAAFNHSRERFGPRHPVFSFRENRHVFHDPSDFEPDNMRNAKNLPGGQVRQQTFDYAHMLRECAWGGPSPGHPESFVLIVEVRTILVRTRIYSSSSCSAIKGVWNYEFNEFNTSINTPLVLLCHAHAHAHAMQHHRHCRSRRGIDCERVRWTYGAPVFIFLFATTLRACLSVM